MLIYRFNNGVSLWNPARSICPHCKKPLSWHELIPIYSYIAQKGKCRHCKKQIHPRYLYTELSYLALGIAAFISHMTIPFFILSLILLATIISDIEYQEIPYTFMAVTLAGILWLGNLTLINLVYVGCFALIILCLEKFVYKRQVFGGADTLFFSILGIHFNQSLFFLFIYLSFITGLVGALFAIGVLKMKRQDALPFTPYIIIAFYLTQYFGQPIIDGYWRLFGA
jgi:prepilin signal peptidase PulO-like enzyme (type II secretory pathway)